MSYLKSQFYTVTIPLLALHSPISPLTSSGQRNCASWESQSQKSVTLLPYTGGRTTKSTRTCGGIGGGGPVTILPTLLKCVNLNSLLVTAILRPQKWQRPSKLKFWVIFHCLQQHTIWGTFHKLTQQNVIIIEITMYETKAHLHGHKNTCSFLHSR